MSSAPLGFFFNQIVVPLCLWNNGEPTFCGFYCLHSTVCHAVRKSLMKLYGQAILSKPIKGDMVN